MSALICGSIAYDTVMVFHDRFKNHILPDKVHMLNVSFLVPELRREYGGCAGNIAYNLHLLGGVALPMATAIPTTIFPSSLPVRAVVRLPRDAIFSTTRLPSRISTSA